MDEVYTCTCGCQEWKINDEGVLCIRCGTAYGWIRFPEMAKNFNARIRFEKTNG